MVSLTFVADDKFEQSEETIVSYRVFLVLKIAFSYCPRLSSSRSILILLMQGCFESPSFWIFRLPLAVLLGCFFHDLARVSWSFSLLFPVDTRWNSRHCEQQKEHREEQCHTSFYNAQWMYL